MNTGHTSTRTYINTGHTSTCMYRSQKKNIQVHVHVHRTNHTRCSKCMYTVHDRDETQQKESQFKY